MGYITVVLFAILQNGAFQHDFIDFFMAPFMWYVRFCKWLVYPTYDTVDSRNGIVLDPRTKLFMLITITTLMFSTSNDGIMNIVKPILSLIPFALILSEHKFKTAGKYAVLYAVCFVLERLALNVWSGNPMSLSGGQKQRAAIASAIASGRSVLFLDEPTSGLDHKHMLEVAEVLREVWDTGISVYVITHDLELIIECCTDVIHFENGTIADQYQMDAEGMEKIRKYFIQGKCCGKWSKSD